MIDQYYEIEMKKEIEWNCPLWHCISANTLPDVIVAYSLALPLLYICKVLSLSQSSLLYFLEVVLLRDLQYYLCLKYIPVQTHWSQSSSWQNDVECQCILPSCVLSMSLSFQ